MFEQNNHKPYQMYMLKKMDNPMYIAAFRAIFKIYEK